MAKRKWIHRAWRLTLVVGMVGWLLCGPWSPRHVSEARAGSGLQIGINLSPPVYYGSELPFVDVMKTAVTWRSGRPGSQQFNRNETLDLDPNGWVKALSPGQAAATVMCWELQGHYPGGSYVCLYEGEGTIEWDGDARVASAAPGRVVLNVTPKRGIMMRITATNPANYIRNIHVLMPGCEGTFRAQPFHPAFLERWRGMKVVRFMDWMHTNGSTVSNWQDRPVPEICTYFDRGVPIEVMVDFCNRIKASPWFCMPHLASDDYVRRFAQMVRERLDPSLNVYVEYSNEVWNGQFKQYHWVGQQGQAQGAPNEFKGYLGFYPRRASQIFQIWRETFGPGDRLVRVLASQAANTFISEQLAGSSQVRGNMDALAIAPYLSFLVDPARAAEIRSWSPGQVVDYLRSTALPQAVARTQATAAIARKNGLRLLLYEGGQHMLAIKGEKRDEAVTRLLTAANHEPQMRDLYLEYLNQLQAAGAEVFCHYSSVTVYNKDGCWGAMEWFDDTSAPKYQALRTFAHL